MEKYCKSCGRVFKKSDFRICPYCGSSLSTREGRKSIPRRLRHQVFQRDGYRCRECGATNKQTRLHVDHIKPVAKGGTNDLSNLQTLCEDCNRAKYTDEWVGGAYDNHSYGNHDELYELNKKQREINLNKSHNLNTNNKLKKEQKINKKDDKNIKDTYSHSHLNKKYSKSVENFKDNFCETRDIANSNVQKKHYPYKNKKILLKKCPKCKTHINNELDKCPVCEYEFNQEIKKNNLNSHNYNKLKKKFSNALKNITSR